MCEVTTYGPLVRYSYDPTRTTTLRNAFARNMRKRFRALTTVIQEAIVQQDVFGLSVQVNADLRPPGYHAFDFPRLTQKVDAFMQWLRVQEELGILEIGHFTRLGGAIEDAWTNIYILDSYKRGVIRARSEMKKAGYRVPRVEESGGIEAILGAPFHVDAVGYVYTRAFSQLVGITAAMDTQISQVLAQGLVDGDHPTRLARKLISTINGAGAGDLGITDTLGRFIPAQRRADMLARTEIIRAHHTANIQEYMNWRAMGVAVLAEWSTSGGNRVCAICADLEGRRFELEEIQNMIPRHPMCRCVALPIEVDPETQEPIIY
jgi:SPP1 gp7 family putative phage head morphogenesis protein